MIAQYCAKEEMSLWQVSKRQLEGKEAGWRPAGAAGSILRQPAPFPEQKEELQADFNSQIHNLLPGLLPW